jgi:hypothetical protein
VPRFKTVNKLFARAIIVGSGHYFDPNALAESPDLTRGLSVTDAAGNVFTFGSTVGTAGDKQTLRNGVAWPQQSVGFGVEYYYKSHTVYLRNSLSNWFFANQTGPTLAWESTPSPLPVAIESPDTTRGNTVTDQPGNVWTLGIARSGGLTTLKNGVAWPPAGPGGLVEYYYKNHTVFGRNNQSLWFRADVANLNWVSVTDPTVVIQPPSATETPDRTQVLADGSITDRWGNIYTVQNGVILRNGAAFVNNTASGAGGFNVVNVQLMMYFRRTLFAYVASNDWYQWFWTANPVAGQTMPLGDWAKCYGHPLSFALVETGYGFPVVSSRESPNRTRGNTITDWFGRVWTLGQVVDGSGNRLILRDGAPLGGNATGSAAAELIYLNHNPAMKMADGKYYDWNNFDNGGLWDYITSLDLFAIDSGIIDYDPGFLQEGLRGTLTEAQMAAQSDPSIVYYGKADSASLQSQWAFTPGAYLPGLVQFTNWQDRANVDVVRAGGKPWNGPNMLSLYRGFTPSNDMWLHAPICVPQVTFRNMFEGGIKLSGFEGDWISVRMWMRKPFKCLPHHMQLAIYVYDLQNELAGGLFGEVLYSIGFLRADVKHGLSLRITGNTFTGTTANPDGKYLMLLDGKRILNITNRLNNFHPSRIIMNRATLQAYHGGTGAPFSDPNNVSGNSIEVQYGPHTVAVP